MNLINSENLIVILDSFLQLLRAFLTDKRLLFLEYPLITWFLR